jgi:hypothetical protein
MNYASLCSLAGRYDNPIPTQCLAPIDFFKYSSSVKYQYCTLMKKENIIFLIYKEIQSGAVAKSYMKKGFLIYEEMRKYFLI